MLNKLLTRTELKHQIDQLIKLDNYLWLPLNSREVD